MLVGQGGILLIEVVAAATTNCANVEELLGELRAIAFGCDDINEKGGERAFSG